jgi:large subunit ribosomal protein L32e
MDEKLLEIRKKRKAKKPDFIRQDYHKKARLSKKWRRPKGIQSKMRYGMKGYSKTIAVGYGSPAGVKGLTREGLAAVLVSNISELKKIEDGQAAVISGRLGQKKKAEIVKKADELGITLLNIKDAKEYLKSVDEIMQKKKAEKQKYMKEKEKKKAEKQKKADEKEKEGLAEKLTDEEKKDKEKKEREKILTKKES